MPLPKLPIRLPDQTNDNLSIVKEQVRFLQDEANLPEFRNLTDLKFISIFSEEYREYTFPNGDKVRIDAPRMLNVSKNGHRVFDVSGVSHYIPQGWIHLEWKAKDGTAHFVK
jgi:hypothetical protein